MSSGLKRSAPQTPQGVGGGGVGSAPKKPTDASNGNGPPAPLTYSFGEPADDVNMNEVEGKVTLDVILPNGKSKNVTVDSNIPMLDLLVHVAATCKVSPSGHSLQVLDEETGKGVEFKPNQTIGSVGASTVHLVSKNKKPEWSKAVTATKAAKGFEITNRFTINLPGGQKAVMRISPQLSLEEVLGRVCKDKSLDSRRYTFQHPQGPLVPLNLKASIAQTGLVEINLVHAGASSASGESSSRSMPDLHRGLTAAPTSPASQDPSTWYMPGAGETKKKKGFLSFLKKDKKFKPMAAPAPVTSPSSHHNPPPHPNPPPHSQASVPHRRPTTPPPERRVSDAKPPPRPKTMYVGHSSVEDNHSHLSKPPTDSAELKTSLKGAGKKRHAPPPPPKAKEDSVPAASASSVPAASASSVAAASASSSASAKKVEAVSVSVKPAAEASSGLSRLHSRNSSDSSGYHELTLSGAESPEAGRAPTTFQTSIDTASIESSDNLNGDSGIQEMSPPGSERLSKEEGGARSRQAVGGGTEAEDKARLYPSTKKKKAPPPPPKAKPAPVEEEEAVSVHSDQGVSDLSTSLPVPAEEPPPPLVLRTEEPTVSDTALRSDDDKNEEEDDDDDDNDDESEAFNLDDILDSVNFDEEPKRSTPRSHAAPTRLDQNEEDEDPRRLAMMETASVISEDVQSLEDLRTRPCEFVAPPPPEEPPPREEELEYVDKGTVVHEDNASLAPSSLKNSPVNSPRHSHRRSGSLSSVQSVDTVQGLSLAFEQTIALGQEALDSEAWLQEDGSGYSSEMARFVATEMQRLTNSSADSADLSSNNTSLSLAETETESQSASDTGSVIRHGAPYHGRHDSKDSQSSLSSVGGAAGRSSPAGRARGSANNAFAMNEEIQAPVETVPPPLQFQNEEEEEEEEEVTTVTEEYIVPMGPRGGLDYSSALRVSQEEKVAGADSSRGVFRAEPVVPVVEEERAKEEFVLTSEDLSCVSLVPLRPKVYTAPKRQVRPEPVPDPPVTEPEHEQTSSFASPLRSHVHLAYVSGRGHNTQPVSAKAEYNQVLRERRGESDEQRPVSTLHLPTMRVSGVAEPLAFSDDDRSSESSSDHLYRSTAKLSMGSRTPDDASDDNWSERAGSRRVSNASSGWGEGGGQRELQAQYGALHEQFLQWQQQLQHNQAALAAHQTSSSSSDGGNDATLKTLQMQMEMQQQMLQQLQTSMQALSLQRNVNGTASPSPSSPSPSVTAPSVATPSPPPPPPPAPPQPVKVESVKAKSKPLPSRFQPQLDPREELMIAIRSFGGRTGLNMVPLKSTKWVNN